MRRPPSTPRPRTAATAARGGSGPAPRPPLPARPFRAAGRRAGGEPGDIRVAANVSWSNNSTLTLSAFHDINIAAGVTISNTAAGNLILRADSSGTGSGTVNFLSIFTVGNIPSGRVDFSQSSG